MIFSNKNFVFAISILIFLVFVFVFWGYSIDDAFVTFRYAENFVNGHGLVFNPGDKPVEGYSNFLWLLILSLFYAIGLPTYLCAKILGVAFFLASAVIWFYFLKKNQNGILWAAPALVLIAPITAFWAVSGLELGLHSLLLAGVVISLLKRSLWSAFLLALVILNRPEGFIVAFFSILLLWVLDRGLFQSNRKFLIINIGTVILSIVLLTAFRMHEFGYPMPNTFYMKSRITSGAFIELGKQLVYFLPVTLLFIRQGLKSFSRQSELRLIGVCAGLFVLQAAISVNALIVMNFHFRYLIAFLPMFIVVALEGLSLFESQKLRMAIWGIIVLSVVSPGLSVWATVQNEKGIMAAQENFIEWAKPLPQSTRFSITDSGRIPYYSGKYFYDIWGLTSADIAHQGFNPLREYIRFPDYFVLVGYLNKEVVTLEYGTERLIYQNRGFKQAYPLAGVARPPGRNSFTPGYYYLIFRKDQQAVDSLLATPPTE